MSKPSMHLVVQHALTLLLLPNLGNEYERVIMARLNTQRKIGVAGRARGTCRKCRRLMSFSGRWRDWSQDDLRPASRLQGMR